MIQGFFLNCTNPTPLSCRTSRGRKILGKALVTLLFLLTQAGLVQAATYYVAMTGGDSNTGTQSAPFRTIRKGISVLSPGDTLYIRSGNYDESINSNNQTLPAGTSWSSAITIAAYPGESVTTYNILLAQSSIRYLVFQGLIIDGRFTWDESVYISGANHIRFKNCEIKNAKHQGVLMPHIGADYNEFLNCVVHHNGTTSISSVPQDHGFYIASRYNLIDGCIAYSNYGYGIQIYNGYGERADGNIIRNCKVYGNGTGGSAAGIAVAGGSDNLVANNLVYNNPRGIDVAYRSPTGSLVYNNTVYANVDGIFINTDSSGAIIKNNIVYQSGSGVTNTGSGTILSNNLIGVDPLFIDAAKFDFHLRVGSPAINAGVTISGITTDFEGITRGNPPEIGAREYLSNQPLPAANLRIVSP
jgi:parallel beta-helix repeat protein